MPYYVFAWITTVAYGLANITGKLTSKHAIKNPYLLNFLWGFFDLTVLAPLIFLVKPEMPKEYFNLMAYAFIWAYGGVLWVYCLSKIDVSVITPLGNLRTGFAVVIGAVFLKEILTIEQYLLVLFIILAGLLVTYEENFKIKKFFNKHVWLLILSTFIFALGGFFTNRSVNINGLWTTVFGGIFFGMIMLLPTIFLFKKEIKHLEKRGLSGIFLTAVISSIGSVSANYAMGKNMSLTSVIISIPVALIIAPLFSKFKPELLEKHSLKVYTVRFAAAAVMIVSAVRLTG